MVFSPTYRGVSYCMCDCHKDGEKVLHIVACCGLTYEKYINKDGQLDMDRVKNLVDQRLDKKDKEE